MGNSPSKCTDNINSPGNMEQHLSVDAVPHRSEALAASSSSTNLEMTDIVNQVAKATKKTIEEKRASGENIDETEVKITNYLQKCLVPYKLSFSYKDAFILCTEKDESEVKEFRDILVNEISLPCREKPKIVLFSEISNSVGNMFEALEFALCRCTFVCLFITSEFIKDKWSEYSSETCLMEAITNPERKWSVVPIRKSSDNVKMPMIIRTLKGVRYDPCDKMYLNMMENLFKDRLSVRKEKEQAHKTKLVEWVQDFEEKELRQRLEIEQIMREKKQKMEELQRQNVGLDHSLSCGEAESQNKMPSSVGLQHSTSCPPSYNADKNEIMREYIRNVGNVEERKEDGNSYIKVTGIPDDFSSPVDDISYTSMPEDSGGFKDGIPTETVVQSNVPVVKQVINNYYYKTTNVNARTVQIGKKNVIKNVNQPVDEDDTSQSVDIDEDDEDNDEEEEEEYILDPLGVGEAKNTKKKD